MLNSTIVSYPDRGTYGKSSYRGNCSGKLIEDIIDHYQLKSLSDYMVGGGTTEDVCRAKKIPGYFTDLNRGYDMLSMDIPERAENIFNHLPYWAMVDYSGTQYDAKAIQDKYGVNALECDLSHCPTWEDFIKKANECILKQYKALDKGGRMFLLMGDMKKKGQLYSMVTDLCRPGTLEQIVIKTQHNCVSDRRTYSNNSFLRIEHEYMVILKKQNALFFPVTYTKSFNLDMRDSLTATWRDTIYSILEESAHPMTLSELYETMEGHKKTLNNPHWKEKIRQTVQNIKYFKRVSEGTYALVA